MGLLILRAPLLKHKVKFCLKNLSAVTYAI